MERMVLMIEICSAVILWVKKISTGQQTASLDGDERLPDNPTYQNDEADYDN